MPATGPPNVVRVALADFRWPLDPALVEGRDETTLARTLYSTPLRTDPATGAVIPGLCTAWRASQDFKRWTFTCRSAPSIAAALRRVARLRRAPGRWLFVDASQIAAPSGSSLVVQLDRPWRRFPYALTAVAAAPRFVPGPFSLVSGSPHRVVVRRPGLTVVFRRLGPLAALHEFRRGRLDEAPIPLGDIVATRRDRALGASLRARTLLAQDVVVFRGRPLQAAVRNAYWQTADRADYEQLVPELAGAGAFGLVGRGVRQDPTTFRAALKAIPSLPGVQVRIGVPPDPVLRFGAGVLYAQWRDVGLGPVLVADSAKKVTADLSRWIAAYPQAEALVAEAVDRSGFGEHLLGAALGSTDQGPALERVDGALRSLGRVIPIAWVVDARLVSPRLQGWREDVLGDVDYSAVRSLASSPRR